jgi:hypothetical protein
MNPAHSQETSTDPADLPVRVCDIVVTPSAINPPALRAILVEMARGNEATVASCRHKDWSEQAQCGCVLGCIGY